MIIGLERVFRAGKRLLNDNFMTNLWQSKALENRANLTFYTNMYIFDTSKGNNMQNERLEKKEAYFKKRQFKLLRAYAKGKLKKAEKLRAKLLEANVNFINKSGFK